MSKNLISLKEASEIFKYHPDHLGFLIREKLIFGEKIGRNWFTTKESVRKYQEQKVTMPVKIFSRIIKIFVFSFLAIILLLVIFLSLMLTSCRAGIIKTKT